MVAIEGSSVGYVQITRKSICRTPSGRKNFRYMTTPLIVAMLLAVASFAAAAAVLPEDRSDLMYHYYSGGGIEVDGPALLIRQGVGDSTSLAASYYADSISGASIDVVTTASPYKEKRDEYSLSADYIYRDNLLTMSYTSSKEPDYIADTYSFDVTHDIFAGLTALSLGYTVGHDVVLRNTDPTFRETLDRYQYRLGFSQIITKNLIMDLRYEAMLDDGFLNNPYRAARILGASVPEKYPSTRASHAVALQLRQGLDLFKKQELRSAFKFDYRYFWDTWGIVADTIELGYQQYFNKHILVDWHYRYYDQSKATFYSDDFPDRFTYMARDKELSSFTSNSLGTKITFRVVNRESFKFSYSLAYDYLKFDYHDFTDVRSNQLYSFNAKTLQLFASIWY